MNDRQTTIWCQWPDIQVPSSCRVISELLDDLDRAELDEISVYVPFYMGGRKTLESISSLPNLEFLQLLTAGYEDALEFMRPGLKLANAAGVHNDSTAELALTLTLASLRGIPQFVRNQSKGMWLRTRNESLSDKTIGIVGYGSIGKTLEGLLSNFPVTIVRFAQSSRENIHSISELDNFLPEIDVVILMVPLTPQTRHLMDRARIAKMKPGALLVNVARGPVVDSHALLEALKDGKISAALDVTDPEPLPANHALWNQENCLIVPHVGGDSSAFEKRARKMVENQMEKFCSGQVLNNLISWEVN